jgi:uncharacterized protein
VDFEWDTDKALSNERKHRVSFLTAARVFLDPLRIEFDEPDDDDVVRFNVIGLVDERMLYVTYTMRFDVVRIISARKAEPHEKRRYYEV